MKTRTLDYKAGDLDCRGFLAESDGDGLKPAVLVIHEAPGLADHPKRRARMLAELGYVALAADLYGGGAEPLAGPAMMERAGSLLGDRPLMRARVKAALDVLKSLPGVDTARVAAIGYCMGGGAVVELARSGAELAGVASFHGVLKTPLPAEPGAILARMLILHGAADSTVPMDELLAAQDEWTRAGADWQTNIYGGAKHAFTNRDVPEGLEAFGYQEAADRRSWQALMAFFDEIFA